jgi:hypothetical protein
MRALWLRQVPRRRAVYRVSVATRGSSRAVAAIEARFVDCHRRHSRAGVSSPLESLALAARTRSHSASTDGDRINSLGARRSVARCPGPPRLGIPVLVVDRGSAHLEVCRRPPQKNVHQPTLPAITQRSRPIAPEAVNRPQKTLPLHAIRPDHNEGLDVGNRVRQA